MWPFDQPPNCATIVSKSVLSREKPILLVSHDEDDHGWQFLDGESSEVEHLALICLSEILSIDPTMVELAALEPGWQAVRSSPEVDWLVEKSSLQSEEENET